MKKNLRVGKRERKTYKRAAQTTVTFKLFTQRLSKQQLRSFTGERIFARPCKTTALRGDKDLLVSLLLLQKATAKGPGLQRCRFAHPHAKNLPRRALQMQVKSVSFSSTHKQTGGERSPRNFDGEPQNPLCNVPQQKPTF